MSKHIDIHSFPKKMARMKELLANGGVSPFTHSQKPISKRNADFILGYENVRSLNGIKIPTRWADVNRLLTIARLINVDFDKLTRGDIKALISTMNEKYSVWTAMKLRMNFKSFLKWIKQGDDYLDIDEYPEEVRWIKRNLKKSDLPKIRETDCWTDNEIKQLLAIAEHPRDKVLVSLLVA